MDAEGAFSLPDEPGIGFEVDTDLLNRYTVRQKRLTSPMPAAARSSGGSGLDGVPDQLLPEHDLAVGPADGDDLVALREDGVRP